MREPTHDELVERAVRWLKGTAGCGVAVPELVTYVPESPDAIGWRDNGRTCILIECKTSRADFLADRNKTFRYSTGLGTKRFYLTPKGLVQPNELFEKWGLLEVDGKRILKTRDSEIFAGDEVHPWGHEALMYSLLRRVSLRGDLRKCLAPKWGGDLPKTVTAPTLPHNAES